MPTLRRALPAATRRTPFGGSAGSEQRLVFYRVLGLVIVDDCPLPDVSLAVSLANFAGPWNLKLVGTVI